MASINMAVIVGYVGRDPKITVTQSGHNVANLSVATSDGGYKTSTGIEVPQTTQWHDVVAWGKTAEFIDKYVHKGTQVYVQGKMRTRKYTDRTNVERMAFEIECDKLQVLDRKPAQQLAQPQIETQGSFDDIDSIF